MVRLFFKNSHKLLQRQQSTILSAAAIITAAIFFSSLLGLVKNRLLVSFFFDDPASRAALDAYWVAFRLPDLVFQLLVTGSLSAAFIPVFSKYYGKDPEKAHQIASTVINLITLVFIVVSLFIFVFARPLNQLFTGENFSPEQLTLASNFTRIMLLAQFFFAISNFLTGIIQAHKRFIIPALAPSAYNLGIITGTIVLGSQIGVYAAAIGVVFGAFLHLILQVPLAIKLGFVYRPVLDLRLPGVKEILRLMPPRTLALSVNQIEWFVFTFLATTLSYKGGLTLVTLSQQLMNLPVRVFAIPIGQASLPFLSQENAHHQLKKFTNTFVNSLHQILYLAIPAAAVLIILRIPLVRIVFGARAFPWEATLLTGKMVAILSLGVAAHAATQLLTRAFYALHNTLTPLFAAIVSVAVSIALSFILVLNTDLGLIGIAIGATAGAFTQSIILFVALLPSLHSFKWTGLLWSPLKMIFASIMMGAFLWVLMRLFDEFVFDTTRTLNLILLTISVSFIGALVYFQLSRALSIPQLHSYLGLLKRLGNWRRVLSSSGETIEQTDPTN